MKKIVSMLLVLIMVLSVFTSVPLSTYAATADVASTSATSGDFAYIVLSDGTAEITRYTGDATEISIPSTLDGYTVTSIGYGAFSSCSSLTSITIPEGVTSIGYYAFSSCSSLTSITIPDSVTSIGDYAFYYCSSLTSITIPDSVTSIGNYAFVYCDSLKDVYYGGSYFDRQNITFGYNNSDLTSATWHYANPEVLVYGYDEDSLTAYVRDCAPTAEEVEIPASVEKDGKTYSVTSIGDSAFDYCSSLTTITIPDSVTSIGDYAFSSCSSLTSITIPDSVTSIGDYAFDYCNSLTDVYYGGSYADRQNITFGYNNSDLTYATWHYANPEVLVYGYNEDSLTAYVSDCAPIAEEVEIPASVEKDGKTYSVTKIGDSAFYNCSKLESITIPDSVTSIGDYAFDYCDSLKDVYYGGSYADRQNITFGYNNSDLTSATWHYANPEVLVYGYDEDSLTAYVSDCAPIAEEVEIPASVEKDGKTYSVTKIGDSAFYGCSSLTSITIPEGVTSIGTYAFYYCYNLSSITIPEGVTSIGSSAFERCNELETIRIFSPVCSIYSNSYTIPTNTVIYGCASSTAQNYAESFNRTFRPLCEDSEIDHKVVQISGYSPTCTQEGRTDGTHCAYCLEVYEGYEIIEMVPHNPVIVPAKSATCHEEGNTRGSICDGCGLVYIAYEIIPKLEHISECDNNAVEPGCGTTGLTDSYSCSLCKEVLEEQKVIDALEHNYVILEGKPATDTQPGLTEGVACDRCGYTLIKQEFIPAIGFALGDINGDGEVSVTDATLLQRHIAKTTVLSDEQLMRADTNRDGEVSVVDATLIQRYVAKIITEL